MYALGYYKDADGKWNNEFYEEKSHQRLCKEMVKQDGYNEKFLEDKGTQ